MFKKIILSFCIILVTVTAPAEDRADPVMKSKEMFDPKRPLERELRISVKDGFTIAAVGDCIISCPLFKQAGLKK